MNNENDTVSGKTKLPKEFFTASTFGTLMGCAMVVWFVSGVISGVFNIEPKFTGFFISIVVAYVGLFLSEKREKVQYVIAFFNGCVIYTMVVGGSSFTPYLNSKTASPVYKKKLNVKTALMKPWIADKNFVIATKLLSQDKEVQANELAQVEGQINEIRDELGGIQGSISPVLRTRLLTKLDDTEESIKKTKSIVEIRTNLLKDMGLKVLNP